MLLPKPPPPNVTTLVRMLGNVFAVSRVDGELRMRKLAPSPRGKQPPAQDGADTRRRGQGEA